MKIKTYVYTVATGRQASAALVPHSGWNKEEQWRALFLWGGKVDVFIKVKQHQN